MEKAALAVELGVAEPAWMTPADYRARAGTLRDPLAAAERIDIYYRDHNRLGMAWAERACLRHRARTRLLIPLRLLDGTSPSRYLRGQRAAGSLSYGALLEHHTHARLRVGPWRWRDLSAPYLLIHLRYGRLLLRAIGAALLYGLFVFQAALGFLKRRDEGTWPSFLSYAEAVIRSEDGLRYYNVPRMLLTKWLEGELYRGFKPVPPSLEIGVDNGVISALHLEGAQIEVGVDFLPSYLLERQPDLRRRYRHLVCADMRHLTFKEGVFTSLVSIHTIDHVDGVTDTLSEYRRVLRPGGQAVFSGLSEYQIRDESPFRWGRLFRGSRGQQAWIDAVRKSYQHFNHLSAEDWRNALGQAGLTPRRFRMFVKLRGNRWDFFLNAVLGGELGGMFKGAFWASGTLHRFLLRAEHAILSPLRRQELEYGDGEPGLNFLCIAVRDR